MYVKNRFYLDEKKKDFIRSLAPKFGYNGFGEAVYYRSYSRQTVDGRQEHWGDTVVRVTEGTFSIRKDWYIKNRIHWDEEYWQKFAAEFAFTMFKMQWLPPGRGLFSMGSDFVYERGSMSLYNCAFTVIGKESSKDFSWLMDSLMHGVGVGFAPMRDKDLIFHQPRGSYDFIIADTRESWCDSVEAALDSYRVPGSKKPNFIYDYIRPAGQPIKGFGGIASGPEPLKRLHEDIISLCESFGTRPELDSVRFKTDIANKIGTCVVAGNVRRSAEIAIGSIHDQIFLDLKNYEKYPERASFGWMSNNSVALKDDSDFELLGEIAKRVLVRGEPGYLNLKNFKFGRIGKSDKNLRSDKAIGLNPCQPGWAKILTPEGIKEFNEIEKDSLIWSKYGWTKVLKKWSTGKNKVFKYVTTAGIFYGTENHRVISDQFKIAVKDAVNLDVLRGPKLNGTVKYDLQSIVDGFIIGDGTDHHGVFLANIGENDQELFNSEIKDFIGKSYNKSYQYLIKTTLLDLPVTYKRKIPERFIKAEKSKLVSFLRGLYSANGSICGNRITLKAASFNVIEAVQLMLSSIGICSYWTKNKENKVQFQNGEYTCKISYDLNISTDRKLFAQYIGFIQSYKNEKLKKFLGITDKFIKPKETFDIVSVELISEEETFDITVDCDSHTYWSQCLNVSNCGEIPLENKEVCNLAETCPTVCQSIEEWYRACIMATFYCSTVTLLPTHQHSTNRIVARNRRIGVGIVDVSGWLDTIGVCKLTRYLRNGYKTVRVTNKYCNEEAGIPESIRVTTIKPGGTIPKLPGKTPGMGRPTFDYTLRRMRVQKNTPIDKILSDAGVPHEPDVLDPVYTEVFEFPILQGPARPADKTSLWEQAMFLVLMQREWSDNAVSNTLYFKPKWIKTETIKEDFWEIDSYLEAVDDTHVSGDLFRDKIQCFHTAPEKFKFLISYKDGQPISIDVFEYNPNHEEHHIEPVLSAIAPLTKSVSLLPHTPTGVYAQMVEEGITKKEYEERLSKIKPINWLEFKGSDGQDEKYCSADSCESSVS